MANNHFIGRLFRGVRLRLRDLTRNSYGEVNINWLTLKYYKHLPASKLRTHMLFSKKLYFYSPAELLHGLKEIFIDGLYKQELPEHPYVIDCGANIGLSVIYIKKLYPQAHILAFEPDERNFEILSRNVESFGFRDVELRREAVWIESGVLNFSGEGTMSSKIQHEGAVNSVSVKAVRLKDLLTRDVDFLKIDIEGAEFAVLADLGSDIRRVKNLFIEYHGSFQQNHELSEMIRLITENGFNYYIKEAAVVYDTPFLRRRKTYMPYDIQLNIFCFHNHTI